MDWLKDEELLEPIDVALLAATESEVDAKIIAASQIRNLRTKHIVAIKKVWLQCKAIKDKDVARRTGTLREDEEEPLDEPTVTEINQAWATRHGFSLGTHRLIADGQFGKIYRETTAQPPKFSIFLLEKIRLLNSIDPKKGQVLVMQPGRSAEVTEIVVEEVRGHHELWLRVRALFTSIALASILRPTWFSLQDCEFFCDLILTYLYQRFNGVMAPFGHYMGAYVSTMQFFQSEVRTRSRSLATAVQTTSGWQHFWTMWQAPAEASSGQRYPGDKATQVKVHPDVGGETGAEILRLKELMRKIQSDKDKEIAALRKSSKEAPTGPRHVRANDGNANGGKRRRG